MTCAAPDTRSRAGIEAGGLMDVGVKIHTIRVLRTVTDDFDPKIACL
jgi:hypothetical protein